MSLALLLAVAGTARADERAIRVGVVAAVTVNLELERAEEIAAALGEELRRALVVDVIAGAEVSRRLPEGGLSGTCVADPACMRDLADRLSAEEILFLVVVRLGDRIQIDPTWYDARNGRTVPRDAIAIAIGTETGTEGEQRAAFERAAPTLLPDARPRDAGSAGSAGAPATTPAAGAATGPLSMRPGDDDQRRGRRITTPVWIAGGAAAAALAGGAGFAIAARRADSSLTADGCDRMPCAESRVKSLERRMLATDLLLATSVAAGTTAAVLYLLSDRLGKDENSLAAEVTSTGAEVRFRWSF